MKPNVDWAAQWELHALNFENGHAKIDLACYGPAAIPLRLLPGAGFGDCSHPTTLLTLRLMAHHVQDCTLLDIGCGSGILSLAGARWGARQVIGIDIEEEALEHAQRNARLNKIFDATFIPQLPPSIQGTSLIVINMISSEQKMAWQSCTVAHRLTCKVIASGILASERDKYLAQVQQERGWYLIDQLGEGGWLAFLFQQTGKID